MAELVAVELAVLFEVVVAPPAILVLAAVAHLEQALPAALLLLIVAVAAVVELIQLAMLAVVAVWDFTASAQLVQEAVVLLLVL
jgi:hypothetical protein